MNTTTTTTTTTTSSSSPSVAAFESPKKGAKKKKKKKKKKVEEGVAVVKESSDPYIDFRDSMMQMIVEMEMYSWEDLRDLLHRFLALNSPYHHHLILRAFAEIWAAGALSPPPPPPRAGERTCAGT
uniref:Transcription repressor n=1 Tax=Ananas comosus var. bracteatus TaxID=296719 RepID=A0A6V7QW92_ANACO